MKSKSRRLSMVVAGAMLLFTVAGCGAKGDDAQIVSELKKEIVRLELELEAVKSKK